MYLTVWHYTHYATAFAMFFEDNPDMVNEESECAFIGFQVWCKQVGLGLYLDDGSKFEF